MSPEKAMELEASLDLDENDYEARCKLLGYYSANRFTDPKGLSRFHHHVLWVIANIPQQKIAKTRYAHFDPTIDGYVIYEKGKKIWLAHVDEHPENQTLLLGAAHYIDCVESATAKHLFKQAEQLDESRTAEEGV